MLQLKHRILFIFSTPKLETTQMSLNKWMYKYMQLMTYILEETF
jgi:N6-adenosine-specific RNA methylase IME4